MDFKKGRTPPETGQGPLAELCENVLVEGMDSPHKEVVKTLVEKGLDAGDVFFAFIDAGSPMLVALACQTYAERLAEKKRGFSLN